MRSYSSSTTFPSLGIVDKVTQLTLQIIEQQDSRKARLLLAQLPNFLNKEKSTGEDVFLPEEEELEFCSYKDRDIRISRNFKLTNVEKKRKFLNYLVTDFYKEQLALFLSKSKGKICSVELISETQTAEYNRCRKCRSQFSYQEVRLILTEPNTAYHFTCYAKMNGMSKKIARSFFTWISFLYRLESRIGLSSLKRYLACAKNYDKYFDQKVSALILTHPYAFEDPIVNTFLLARKHDFWLGDYAAVRVELAYDLFVKKGYTADGASDFYTLDIENEKTEDNREKITVYPFIDSDSSLKFATREELSTLDYIF